uniref:Uncharacterized protein n=1 Tax=Mimivirus LCMiAC02 TaxID=2506609 RepID=A0A481Z1B2_9VIRU|nr:MAG: hypothetical protein LCMiAC02_01230 [Mimivirus LCMiAC02]
MNKAPKFKKDETYIKYKKRLDNYNVEQLKERYNLLLKFINKWLGYDGKYGLKSIKQFKNVPRKELLYDLKHNRKILRKYSNEIKEKLDLTFVITDETDSDEINDQFIIIFLGRSLSSIGYKLVSKKIDIIVKNGKNKGKPKLIKKGRHKGRRKKDIYYTIIDKHTVDRDINCCEVDDEIVKCLNLFPQNKTRMTHKENIKYKRNNLKNKINEYIDSNEYGWNINKLNIRNEYKLKSQNEITMKKIIDEYM